MTEINILLKVQELEHENEFLQRQNAACKLRCREYSQRVMDLEAEIADMKFTHNYLTSEKTGRQIAHKLSGGV